MKVVLGPKEYAGSLPLRQDVEIVQEILHPQRIPKKRGVLKFSSWEGVEFHGVYVNGIKPEGRNDEHIYSTGSEDQEHHETPERRHIVDC